ncbi:hypothetical protein B0H10DRAFT_1094100 [Mycena sp. CBHHK59/15]|nr:hypothetical protein B0H10DRAFT_1094100 [Mycena sp. CBHHK59/15]
MIPLGDLYLGKAIRVDDRSGLVERRRGGSVKRVHVTSAKRMHWARIEGRSSDMTAVVYQGQNAEEDWRWDINQYSGIRHPNILQIYGVVKSQCASLNISRSCTV